MQKLWSYVIKQSLHYFRQILIEALMYTSC
ncbi:Uncharacterised protein [Escherichia coli]|nr:Uncharacterised protein [Escherichia coli]